MRKVLIVKPDYEHFPLGLAYVMASLRESRIPYDYVDTVFDRTSWSSVLSRHGHLRQRLRQGAFRGL